METGEDKQKQSGAESEEAKKVDKWEPKGIGGWIFKAGLYTILGILIIIVIIITICSATQYL